VSPAERCDLVGVSQVCLDIIGDNSNYLSNCRCSCGVLAADVEGVKLYITIQSNRIDSIATANTEYSHKDKEIDRLRSELSIEKARSEKLESELSLFVKERSLEIEKLNQTIVSLENKIIEHDQSNASLKLFIDIDQQRISKPQIPEQSNYKQSAYHLLLR
jgi:predicted  nucleic acid-binding Zn-ribbon protein